VQDQLHPVRLVAQVERDPVLAVEHVARRVPLDVLHETWMGVGDDAAQQLHDLPLRRLEVVQEVRHVAVRLGHEVILPP
jgi:hypothetical protein